MVDINNRSAEEIVYDEEGTQIKNKLFEVSKSSAFGNIGNSIGRAFYGINHRGQPGIIPINKDYHGLTFFTRPELNFSEANLRNDRRLTKLLTGNDYSMERIIRCYLDPRVQSQYKVKAPLVDNNQAFIPILTNTLLSISGWPDDVNPTFESDPGMYGEVFGHIDGPPDIYRSYDVTANFRNVIGDPVTKLFYYWSRYARLVHEGLSLVAYPENIIERRVDYNTRIYRLVLDETKTYVTEIAACGASFPLSSPTGAKFNFEHDKPINDSNDQISIPFRCYGFISYDDILIKQFNTVVGMFNRGMQDDQRTNGSYVKVPINALSLFNNYGYPRIDPYTKELEWWVSAQVFNDLLPGILDGN